MKIQSFTFFTVNMTSIKGMSSLWDIFMNIKTTIPRTEKYTLRTNHPVKDWINKKRGCVKKNRTHPPRNSNLTAKNYRMMKFFVILQYVFFPLSHICIPYHLPPYNVPDTGIIHIILKTFSKNGMSWEYDTETLKSELSTLWKKCFLHYHKVSILLHIKIWYKASAIYVCSLLFIFFDFSPSIVYTISYEVYTYYHCLMNLWQRYPL